MEGLVYHSTRACCKKHRLGLRALGFEAVVTMEEKIASMVFVRQQRLDNKHITFTQLRRRFCGSQVSWKRDFFYGFLGIVTGSTPLSPSYKLPLRTAISEATYACVTKETDGVALLLGERLFRSQNPYTRLHVPSWVSDACFCTFPQKWGLVERRRLSMYESFNAGQNGAGQSSPRQNSAERQTFVNNLSMSKNGILVTESYQIGKIDEVGDVLVDTNQWTTVPRVLLSWMEMAGINPLTWPASPVDLDEGKMVFWRTMINDSVEKDGDDSVEEVGESPQYQRPSIAESYQELHKLWEAIGHRTLRAFFPSSVEGAQTPRTNPDPHHSVLHNAVVSLNPKLVYHLLACLWERRLFKANGKIGLSPRDTEKGDEIHVILGYPAPFILRPLGKPGSPGAAFEIGDRETDPLPQYMVVGNGFFDGYMGGRTAVVSGHQPRKVAIH